MALFHGFGVLPISNIVELLQGCSLCLKEGNREEEPVLRIAIDQCRIAATLALLSQHHLTSLATILRA